MELAWYGTSSLLLEEIDLHCSTLLFFDAPPTGIQENPVASLVMTAELLLIPSSSHLSAYISSHLLPLFLSSILGSAW